MLFFLALYLSDDIYVDGRTYIPVRCGYHSTGFYSTRRFPRSESLHGDGGPAMMLYQQAARCSVTDKRIVRTPSGDHFNCYSDVDETLVHQ
ncbi:hypothetical protein V6N11_024257 [Hibiscus sabdariffa]|uniref:Uncharacterized protein n=1 Tax=Hibiscus sabdariffa TaxID=183260 RepID=A0ABR1ZEE4_9ROSI